MQSTLVSFLGIFNFIPIQSFSIFDEVNSTENVNCHDLQAILMTLLKPESNTTDFAMSGPGSCWHEDFYRAHICVKGAKEIRVSRVGCATESPPPRGFRRRSLTYSNFIFYSLRVPGVEKIFWQIVFFSVAPFLKSRNKNRNPKLTPKKLFKPNPYPFT